MIEQLKAITVRNLKLYLRDKGTVFFSLLSMVIVIALMTLFLGDMQVETITNLLKQFPGYQAAEDDRNAKLLVLSWTSAGILSINAVTVTLSALSSMIKDKADGRICAIDTAPVSRMLIALGYVLAAWTASVIICILTLFLTELYGVFCGMEWFSIVTHVKLTGMIMINSFAYASLMYVAAVFVKSEGAWSGLGTIVGTLTGFLGGIYLPIGQLSEEIGRLMKCTPLIYGTAMFRQIMTKDVAHRTFQNAPQEAEDTWLSIMGVDLSVLDHAVSIKICLLLLLIFGAIFLMIGTVVLRYKKKTDR